MPQQTPSDPLLMFSENRWTAVPREGCSEVQMKASVDAPLAGQSCGAFRILHEHHCANRRHRLSFAALKRPISCFAASSPLVSIDYEAASFKRLDWRTSRHSHA